MRTQRSIRHRGKRRKKDPIDLDITSLLDILVIMLVFLLKSYNSSGIVLNVPKGVLLPVSQSVEINSTGVNIQISPDTVWVDDRKILTVDEMNKYPRRILDRGRRRIIPLYNELVTKKNTIERIQKSAKGAQKFSGMVNLIIDKSMKYSFIKKVMFTCAEAGFKKYKFVVLGEE
ncbi:MAG: biopolymer transporter ExbD [Bacteriovoracaceae bacterium]|nr:biopolymer transporter ExbD [Bacteriovoracaceae bacterium]